MLHPIIRLFVYSPYKEHIFAGCAEHTAGSISTDRISSHMNLHPHAVLSRVLWRWYQSPSGFKPLRVFWYLTVVPVSPFGPLAAGRTHAGPSIGPLSVGILHSPPSGIPVAVFYARRPRWSSFQPAVSGYARNRKSSVPSHAPGNAFLRMFAAPLQSALIL